MLGIFAVLQQTKQHCISVNFISSLNIMISLSVNFINILCTASMGTDPKSAKRYWRLDWIFTLWYLCTLKLLIKCWWNWLLQNISEFFQVTTAKNNKFKTSSNIEFEFWLHILKNHLNETWILFEFAFEDCVWPSFYLSMNSPTWL